MRAIYVEKDLPRMLAVIGLRRVWPGVIWSGLSPAHVVDLPEPALPGSRWLRVRNTQCGICATDLSLLQVKVDPAVGLAALPGNTRFYLGHEVVGEVVEVGPNVDLFEVGDRVVMESRFLGPNCLTQEIEPPCRHCAAEQTRLCENASAGLGPVGSGGGWGDAYTAHQAELRGVPQAIDDDQASLIEPMAVALHGVLRHPPRAGEKVLIIGAGIIGLLTLQMVRIVEPEAEITVMARYPHQIRAAERFGAHHILGNDDGYASVAEVTGGHYFQAPLNRGMVLGGYDLVLDCVGNGKTVTDGLRWARGGGVVVLVGISLGMVNVDLSPVWNQEVDLIGSNTFGIENWRGRRRHTFDHVIDMLQEGVLEHEGLITHRFGLDDIRQAVKVADDKRSGSIKVSLNLSNSA